MKHLCCSKFLALFLLFIATLYGALNDKSAIVYLGDKISYPMAGIHDYIIVDPKKTNPYTHGFEVYNDKIYAHVLINESITAATLLSSVQELQIQGYKNFFFDMKNTYNKKEFLLFLTQFRVQKEFTGAKVILQADDQKLLEEAGKYINTILIYNASKDQNLAKNIMFYKRIKNEIIDVETSRSASIAGLTELGFIPFITTPSMNTYGQSTKNALKREVLTLIDESIDDRMELAAHRYGALTLEYYGYIQKLYDIRTGLPNPENMMQYTGVIVWLNVQYDNPTKLIQWIKEIHSKNIPVVFAYDFGFDTSNIYLQQLGIQAYDGNPKAKKTITHQDAMMNFEIQPPINQDTFYLKAPKNSQELLTYTDSDGMASTTAAITPWGGYALGTSFFVEVDGENLWAINPFEFFKKALRLEEFPVPDSTTENGNRLFFSHVDGDGILNGAEFNPELFSGDVIYNQILKQYPIPHSVSVIGAEVMPNGLYPQQSHRLLELLKKIYALDNVEPATHTFSHPFYWGAVQNGNLQAKDRLQVPDYTFSLNYELSGMLAYIQDNLLKYNSTKKAKTVFWSGDCNPRADALELIAKNSFLNFNGGDTTISNIHPWLTRIAPLGLERNEYYQIYTGAQNENVFTNDWLGPYWGFKRVVQTFELTNSPRRIKPIDVYYHLYSGSKKASLNALRYVFDWVMSQKEIMPVFTSEYIPKVMDYYTVSIAKENNSWLFEGMKDLKTLRVEKEKSGVDMQNSETVLGVQHFESHTYISLDQNQKHLFKTQPDQTQNTPYIVSANGKIDEYTNSKDAKQYKFSAYVPLELKMYLPKKCRLNAIPEGKITMLKDGIIELKYKSNKKAIIDVRCQ